MELRTIIDELNRWAPPILQESYDNAGLLVGELDKEVKSALITLDVTEAVLDEAIEHGDGLIIAHHPVIFGGLKKLTGGNDVERIVMKAIRGHVAIYAAHTNLDLVGNGVNRMIGKQLGLHHMRVLSPKKDSLKKLTVFCPEGHEEQVRNAIFEAGAGEFGGYDQCSFSTAGFSTFRAGPGSDPYVGQVGERHQANETRIEAAVPVENEKGVVAALLAVHPYETVAYDLVPLTNSNPDVGFGMIGELEAEVPEQHFLETIRETMKTACIRHTDLLGRPVKKVAVCGGAGGSLLEDAIASGADIFITSDIKYHRFFDPDGRIVLADIGHYESEQFTIDLFIGRLREKFPNFALRSTAINTNPVNYHTGL